MDRPSRIRANKHKPKKAEAAPNKTRQKVWFRLVAVVGIPCSLLLLTEATLRLADYGYSPGFFRAGTAENARVWTENAGFGRRFFPPGLVRRAQPFTIASPKDPNTLRIFVLGESAAMGDPDFKFGLPRMLQVLLRERYPDRRFEVINCGVVAINSHVILPIAADCASRQGDLWVIYMGNNEVVGPFGSASVFGARAPPLMAVRASLALKKLRLGQLLDAVLRLLRPSQKNLTAWTGMEMMSGQAVRHDAPESQRVYHNFERNLRDILATGAHAGVPVVLCTVASNLRNCGPFASVHSSRLTTEKVKEWQADYDSAVAAQDRGDYTNALAGFESAAKIDSEFAELPFRMGQCSRLLGFSDGAARYFTEARDHDALQFRADSEINQTIRRTAAAFADQRVQLMDAERLFATNSPQGPPGAEYFYEHVHLTPEGNYLLARAVAEQAAKGLDLPAAGNCVSQAECFQLLGLTEWNRYDAFNTILDRIQSAPFTNQVDHAEQMRTAYEQLARYRLATKPAQVRRQAAEIAPLVTRFPQDADLRWNLATLLQTAGDYHGAEEQWRALIRLQPQSPLPAYNLTKLLQGLDDRGSNVLGHNTDEKKPAHQ